MRTALTEWRQRNFLSLTDAARKLGMYNTQLLCIERGRHKLQRKTIKRIVAVTGLTEDQLKVDPKHCEPTN